MNKKNRYVKYINPLEHKKTKTLFAYFLESCTANGNGIIIHPQVGHFRHDDFGNAIGEDFARKLANGGLKLTDRSVEICAARTINKHSRASVYFAWWPLGSDLEIIEKHSWTDGFIACRDKKDLELLTHKFYFIEI